MSIIDQLNRPLHDLRISVIDRCNFRCPYCMPQEEYNHSYQFLKKEEWLSFDEILRLIRILVELGVRKVRLTGGEPLLRPNLDQLVRQISTIKEIEDIALTTNGSNLTDHLDSLQNAGLKRMTISLDSLDENVFKELTGSKGILKDVIRGIKEAKRIGFKNIKINSVIQKGVNEDSIIPLVNFAREEELEIRFIEYMDVGNQNHWQLAQVLASKDILDRLQQVYPLKLISTTKDGDTANVYQYLDKDLNVGFVSAVTEPFCGSCNRLRLSANGQLYTCLFASKGHDLKVLLRNSSSDERIRNEVLKIWHLRDDRYSQLRLKPQHQQLASPKVEMYQVGG